MSGRTAAMTSGNASAFHIGRMLSGPVTGFGYGEWTMPAQGFSPAVREWFRTAFEAPTAAQEQGWPAISSGEHTLILAPTGSGKTLAAFLWGLDRLAAEPVPEDPR